MKLLLILAGLASLATAECDMAAIAKISADVAAKACLTEGTADCTCLNEVLAIYEDSACANDDNFKEAIAQYKKLLDEAGCSGCFPAHATVELANGKIKSMDQVVLGDKLRVGPNEFSEVYLFTTQMAETTSKFSKIVTNNASLLLTPGHYIHVNGGMAQARDVKVGDVVVLASGEKAPVTEVDSAWGSGLFNPHTMHGDVVVDGIKTSTYTDAVHPTLAHALLSPLRVMYSAGISMGSDFRGAVKGLPQWVLQAINA